MRKGFVSILLVGFVVLALSTAAWERESEGRSRFSLFHPLCEIDLVLIVLKKALFAKKMFFRGKRE